jgi:hypothetical protein
LLLHHLPPHLREVCQILAAAMLRLRCRTAEDFARDAELARGERQVSLHYPGRQSVHANPKERVSA